MTIAAFVGSGNKNGNTTKVVRRIIAGAGLLGAKAQLFHLCEYRIKPCTGCRACEKTNRCVITDDDVPVLHRAIEDCDALIFGTPTYYGSVTGVFKQFVDRCYPYCVQDIDIQTRICRFGSTLPAGKPGILVAVSGGHGPEVFDSHEKITTHCFNDLNVTFWRKLLVPYTTFEPVSERHTVWEEAYQCGVELYHSFSGQH